MIGAQRNSVVEDDSEKSISKEKEKEGSKGHPKDDKNPKDDKYPKDDKDKANPRDDKAHPHPSVAWQEKRTLLSQIQRPLSQRLLEIEMNWEQVSTCVALYVSKGQGDFGAISATPVTLGSDPILLAFSKFCGAAKSTEEEEALALRVITTEDAGKTLSSPRKDGPEDVIEVDLLFPSKDPKEKARRESLQIAVILKEGATLINLTSFSATQHSAFALLKALVLTLNSDPSPCPQLYLEPDPKREPERTKTLTPTNPSPRNTLTLSGT